MLHRNSEGKISTVLNVSTHLEKKRVQVPRRQNFLEVGKVRGNSMCLEVAIQLNRMNHFHLHSSINLQDISAFLLYFVLSQIVGGFRVGVHLAIFFEKI